MHLGGPLFYSVLLAGCLISVPGWTALAQRPGGGGAPPGAGGPPGGGMPPSGGMPSNTGVSGAPMPNTSRENNTMSTVHSGLQLGPPGRWWDDKHYVKALHLRSEQQKRMDSLFEQNKASLVSKYQALQQEESKMEALSHADALDEGALFAQIDRVAQARADLEKANTHLMLQVRKEMDADQTARLDKLH
jgi:hypothetical protein